MQAALNQDPMMATMEAVKEYHNLGLTVIPVCKPIVGGTGCNIHGPGCKSPGKVPIVREWTKVYRGEKADARIIELFAQENWDLNVGILTGKDHNLYVVDIDGPEGGQSLIEENDMGILEPTVFVTTGRPGGYHYWYRPIESDPPMPKKIGFLNKVDFIGEGGFVLAPPSLHRTGVYYRWDSEPLNDLEAALEAGADPIGVIAEWTRDLVNVKGRRSNLLLMPLQDDSNVTIGERARTFLTQGAVDGQRLEACHAIANLHGRGIPEDEIIQRVAYALMDLSPQTKPNDPWTFEQVEDLVKDMVKKNPAPKVLPDLPTIKFPVSENQVKDSQGRVRDLFDALTETEVDETILEGIVFKNKCHVNFAASGTGKTLWMLEMMLHVAAGREWHGRRVNKSKVLLVEIDDTYQLRGYLESMRDAYGFTREELSGNFITNKEDDTDFDLETANNRLALQAFVETHSPDVVVLDHLEGFLPKVDSYGNAKYHQFRQFKDWCKGRGITLWAIDHSVKGWKPSGDDGQPNNHLEALSGGQQKLAIFDVGFHMYGALEEGPVTIWYAKLRDRKPDPISWSFGAEGSTLKAKPKNDDIYGGLSSKETKVVEYICNHGPVSTQEILEHCSLSKATFHRLLQAVLLPRRLVARKVQGGGGRGDRTTYGIGELFQNKSNDPSWRLS